MVGGELILKSVVYDYDKAFGDHAEVEDAANFAVLGDQIG